MLVFDCIMDSEALAKRRHAWLELAGMTEMSATISNGSEANRLVCLCIAGRDCMHFLMEIMHVT